MQLEATPTPLTVSPAGISRVDANGLRGAGAPGPLSDRSSQMAGFGQSRFNDLEELLKRMDQ